MPYSPLPHADGWRYMVYYSSFKRINDEIWSLDYPRSSSSLTREYCISSYNTAFNSNIYSSACRQVEFLRSSIRLKHVCRWHSCG